MIQDQGPTQWRQPMSLAIIKATKYIRPSEEQTKQTRFIMFYPVGVCAAGSYLKTVKKNTRNLFLTLSVRV